MFYKLCYSKLLNIEFRYRRQDVTPITINRRVVLIFFVRRCLLPDNIHFVVLHLLILNSVPLKL
jgi:hypothetical protein